MYHPLQLPSLDVCLLEACLLPSPLLVDRQRDTSENITFHCGQYTMHSLNVSSMVSSTVSRGKLVMTKLVEEKVRKTADDNIMILEPQHVCLFSITNMLHWSSPYRSGTLNSNTVNSNPVNLKFHFIRSFCEMFVRFLSERSQNTILLASTQVVYKAPHSTVRHTQTDTPAHREVS